MSRCTRYLVFCLVCFLTIKIYASQPAYTTPYNQQYTEWHQYDELQEKTTFKADRDKKFRTELLHKKAQHTYIQYYSAATKKFPKKIMHIQDQELQSSTDEESEIHA